MTSHVIAIRPEPGLAQTLARAQALGIEVTGEPMFKVEPRDWQLPDPLDFDGVLIGSANAIRHGGAQISQLVHLPAFAVGRSTALLAKEHGFRIARTGQGGLQDLLDVLPDTPIRLLRLAGSDHVPLVLRKNQRIVERIVYKSAALTMPDILTHTLKNDAVVMLHSARAAEHFTSECNRIGIDRRNVRLAVFGPRVAEAAGSGWLETAVADQPSDAALLALVQKMCK